MTQQSFAAHGKLLLTSEYFVLDGAKAIALPTRFGQKMKVSKNSRASSLTWQAFEPDGSCWLDAEFDLENFDILREDGAEILQSLLNAARVLNTGFLKEGATVNTTLDFPKDWGLGTSSTLVYMLAKWAQVDPFRLLRETIGGSGYDIACAGAQTSIFYHLNDGKPVWNEAQFNPSFKENLYFVYLNKKQSSSDAIKRYQDLEISQEDAISTLNNLSDQILCAKDIDSFDNSLREHEKFIAGQLQLVCVQESLFEDYWGQTKSLGAWGGDFILATSTRPEQETRDYFTSRGYNTILNYTDMIL